MGSDPQPAQVIPAPAPPNYQATAGEAAQAQLTYNPQLAAQNVQLQGQYGPQVAQQQYDLSAQYGPMYRALIEQQFPQIGMLSNQVSQGLASPRSLTVDQQAAQDAIRQRAYDASAKGIRESANVGGTLYGGRRELREDRARNELAQGFATQDIQLQQQQRQQSMSELAMLFQLAFPNVQQPGQIGLNTGVSDPTNSLYNALVQNQGNFGIIQPTAGQPSGWAQAGGAAAGAATAKLFFMCLPGSSRIDTHDGQKPIAEVSVGDRIGEFTVKMKYEYIAEDTPFVKLEFTDGITIETCDKHVIDSKEIQWYIEGDVIQGHTVLKKTITLRTEKTYDLLTNAPDGGYESSGIHIPSMIPTLHKMSALLQEVA